MLLSLIPQLSEQTELILVGDGISELMSLSIQKKHPEISIYTIPKTGANSARQYGIEKSQGDYILLSDSDDVIPDQTLLLYQTIIQKHQPDIIIGNVERYTESVNQGIFYHFTHADTLLYKNKLSDHQLYSFPVLIFCKCFNRNLMKAIRFEDSSMYQDFSISANLFKQANSLFFTNEIVYCYYARKDSVSSSESNTPSNLMAALPAVYSVIDHYNIHTLSSIEKKFFTFSLIRFYFTAILRSIPLHNIDLSNRLRKDALNHLFIRDLFNIILVPKPFIMGIIIYSKIIFILYYKVKRLTVKR
jgi:glycosyltransferase involved in cell wall biosynthesis